MSFATTRIRFAFSAFLMVCTTVIGVAGVPVTADAVVAETCRGRTVTISGTTGDDEIQGTSGNDVINGLGGNDVIHGLGGADIICGGAGNDIIYGNRGNDWIYGGPGDDALYGQRGHDRLFGYAGTDSLFGGLYADVCVGENEANCETDYRGERDEQVWRDLVDEFFGDIGETDNALVIVACESNGDPFAVNPNGQVPKGLWQFIPSTWEWATPFTGWDHEHRFHPRAATETARWLYDWADGRTRQDGSEGQGFDPWVHCRCLLPEYNCQFDLTAVNPS
ncbi:MAG: transglycosylase SLT domain-containing protein [Acidimicrobiia bacterium]|nr:transglycosylase SLT domain-containing protein [Acidimicrobiia bacterium]